jgi:hypothetical protein
MGIGFLKCSGKAFACRKLLKVIGYEGKPYRYAFGLSAKSDPAPG